MKIQNTNFDDVKKYLEAVMSVSVRTLTPYQESYLENADVASSPNSFNLVFKKPIVFFGKVSATVAMPSQVATVAGRHGISGSSDLITTGAVANGFSRTLFEFRQTLAVGEFPRLDDTLRFVEENVICNRVVFNINSPSFATWSPGAMIVFDGFLATFATNRIDPLITGDILFPNLSRFAN